MRPLLFALKVKSLEEGSREFDLVKRDENGNILNSVIHLLTRPSENPALNINQDFLLERVLRKHPNVIGVGEMRSAAESLSAAESSRTGHTVCTTIHSNSCNSTYRRMMTLAKRKYSMDDAVLMEIMVEAYPIVVFTKQLEDRSRTTGILILSALIAFMSSFVIGYAVRFMLGQRKKEFAAYELMGMEVKTVRNLFLVENGIIGGVAFLLGALIGTGLSGLLNQVSPSQQSGSGGPCTGGWNGPPGAPPYQRFLR